MSGPAHTARLTLNADGTFTYTPAANYNGPDSFTYKANDGDADSNVATVTIDRQRGQRRAGGGRRQLHHDRGHAADGRPRRACSATTPTSTATRCTAVLVSGPTHGTLTLNADGTFTYTPAANYNGADSFTYKANDGDARLATWPPSRITVDCGQRRAGGGRRQLQRPTRTRR